MRRRSVTVLIASILAGWTFAGGFGQEQTEESAEPVLEYARDADTVVIQMYQLGAFTDGIPRIRIYGDGRVLVHRYTMRDREMYIPGQQIDVWLRYLYDLGVLTFDSDRVEEATLEIIEARDAEAAARGEPNRATSSLVDVRATIIEVRLNVFKTSGVGAERVDDYIHRAAWDAPRYSANKFPEVSELSAFADAADALVDLTRHSDLVLIDEK